MGDEAKKKRRFIKGKVVVTILTVMCGFIMETITLESFHETYMQDQHPHYSKDEKVTEEQIE